MVVDIAHVRNIGPEIGDHRPHPAPRLQRIDCTQPLPGPLEPSTGLLEVNPWHEMPIVGRALSSRIGHRKQRHLVSPGTQQPHSLEHVGLGPAESVVIFVAEQYPHEVGSGPESLNAGGRAAVRWDSGVPNPGSRATARAGRKNLPDSYRD